MFYKLYEATPKMVGLMMEVVNRQVDIEEMAKVQFQNIKHHPIDDYDQPIHDEPQACPESQLRKRAPEVYTAEVDPARPTTFNRVEFDRTLSD
ncbi:hypothetical protein Q6247_25555, partial [Klebsiella pneumoniae]